MSLLVWKHACLLCSLMALFIVMKEWRCWKSQWWEHGCCVQNTPRKGHAVLFLWASGIQRLGPFAAPIKILLFKDFLTWVESRPLWHFIFNLFVCFVVFLGNWAVFDHYLNLVPDLCGKYGQQRIWLKILPQPTHDLYIHNLFMISINAYFRLRQLIEWKYVQIICFAVIYHSFQMSQLNRLHQVLTCHVEYTISLRSMSKGSFQKLN